MRPLGFILIASLALAGCAKSPAEREMADDTSCRKIITERNDTRPNAYQECRGHLMTYRNQNAVADSGRVLVNNNISRNPLCGIGSQAAGMNC